MASAFVVAQCATIARACLAGPPCSIPSSAVLLEPQAQYSARHFGRSVAVEGDWIAVGVRGGSTEPPGRVELHRRIAGRWSPAGVLLPSVSAPGDGFGTALDIDGDTLLVGADSADGAIVDTGVAWIYRLVGDVWQEEAMLMLPDGQALDLFGSDVDLDGEFALIGAAQRDDLGESSGAAYLFQRSDRDSEVRWSLVATLFAPDGAAGDQFGYSVELEGNIAVVGSLGDDDGEVSIAGSIRIFESARPGWSQTAHLQPSSIPFAGAGPTFGRMISLRADTLLVNFGTGGPVGSGLLELVRSESGWSPPRLVTAGGGQSHQRHALALGPDGDVAAWAAGTGSPSTFSRIAILQRDTAGWSVEQEVQPPSAVPGANGVTSIDFDGETLVMGRTGSFSDDPGAVMVAHRPARDTNMNGLDDECELANGLATDCDGDGILDDRQIPFRFAADNIEDTVLPTVWTAAGAESLSALMLNHFVVTSDAEPRVHSIAFMVPNFPDFGGTDDPISEATLLVWSDPDGDGNPADARLLRAQPTSLPRRSDLSELTSFAIDPVEIGPAETSFFAGVLVEFAPGQPFTQTDDVAPHRQAGWLLLAPSPLDPSDLSSNPPQPVELISGPPVQARALSIRVNVSDCDASGVLDTCEILDRVLKDADGDLVADVCQPLLGDLDGDGVVGATDLGILLGSWGPCRAPPAPCAADLDGDGDVDGADAGVLLSAWSG